MAALTTAVKIGVIAEEKNDVEVMYELTCKIIKENRFSFKHFLGHGCGKIRKKCRGWAMNLLERGCSHIVVVHDLDNRDQRKLRVSLENELKDIEFREKVILIPVEEIEAWLLSDPGALKIAFGMRKLPKTPRFPETIQDPKETLSSIIAGNSKTQYLNTIHNKLIAKEISISRLKRCPSFSLYPKFLMKAFPKFQL